MDIPYPPPGAACPLCGGDLRRVRRHTLDRVLNLFRRQPQLRYRCMSAPCHAELCLPAPAGRPAAGPLRVGSYTGQQVLEASRLGPVQAAPLCPRG